MTPTRSHHRPRTHAAPHRRSAPAPAAADTSLKKGRLRENWRSFNAQLAKNPGLDYLMIRLLVLLITGIGVVMVFSSSMASSVQDGATVWSEAARHAIMVALGLVAFWVALKIPMEWVRKLAGLLMIITVALLVLVLTPLGTGGEQVGSQAWLPIGPIQIQPSELAKVAIAVWGASYLAGHRPDGWRLGGRFLNFTAVSVAIFLLIVAQKDLGMAVSFMIVVGFVLFFAGTDFKLFITFAIVGVVALIGFVLSQGGFRSRRIHTYFEALTGNFSDTAGPSYQSYQGFLSLADGSLSGVGLGQSRAKWFYLPEAKNDFIFAVIGEELGLWGGALVIILFTLLGVFGLRAAMRAQNHFQALLAAALTAGVVSQAFINIGYVVGLLPVTGIQLPMISAGGTSAVITLGSMGLLASVARHEPPSISAMQNYGRPFFDRILFINEPVIEGDARVPLRGGQRPHKQPQDATERFGRPVTESRPRPARGANAGSVERNQHTRSRQQRQPAHPRRR